MKVMELVGERFRNFPSDISVESHAIMVRGGYIKNVANGIFSLYTPMRRITRKIEKIIREEMDAIGGQEVLFPVVLPASLWQESGRYTSIGSEMIRFTDRNDSPLVLGMTHEEAAVHLVREYASTYNKYPFMIYQIQTKFRDEARPRGGLIRVREFTMKDAYSFHTSQNDLEEYYSRCYEAYERIFTRVGVPEVISVASDSGMMGGNISHEFMLLTSIGEDSIVLCQDCDYRANMEAAECITEPNHISHLTEPLSKISTPDHTSIDNLCEALQCKSKDCCKAVVYQDATDKYVIVFIRGDLEVNETKLRNLLGCEIYPAKITEESNLVEGYIGPYALESNSTVFYDRSLMHSANMICGANESGYHYINLNIERDIGRVDYHDIAKVMEGCICPKCGHNSLTVSNGIEVGNIFQLGQKYTKSMNMTYTDSNGNLQYPIMGCYGIGVGRLAASICEAHHDELGPIWPMSIAPWQVELCALRIDDVNVKTVADELYQKLLDNGIEVLYDDRSVSAGVMFADADLLGIPIRLIISPRNVKNDVCELATRDKKISLNIAYSEVLDKINEIILNEKAGM